MAPAARPCPRFTWPWSRPAPLPALLLRHQRQQQQLRRCRGCVVRAAERASRQVPPPAAARVPLDALRPPLLARARQSLGEVPPGGCELRGHGQQCGLQVDWRLRLEADGSFREELSCPELTWAWGWDAAGGVCWEVDDAALPRVQELDDREAMLLSVWTRTGAWARVACAAQLTALTGEGAEREGEAALVLELAQARLELDRASGLPLRMSMQRAGETETWHFSSWTEWDVGSDRFIALPSCVLHEAGGGMVNTFAVDSVGPAAPDTNAAGASGKPALPRGSSPCGMPPCPLLPDNTRFLPDESPEVPAWWTPSGHILVRPEIDGALPGYFILDTGASGLVLAPSAAAALGLATFGELLVTGMARQLRSSFCRARVLRLGPLEFTRPTFLTMDVAALVQGAPGPVVGIVGYDVFRRAVVDLPPRPLPRPQAADEDVLSPAAAVAAALAARASTVEGRIGIHHPQHFSLALGLDCSPDPTSGSRAGGGSAAGPGVLAAAASCGSTTSAASSSTTTSTSSWLPLLMIGSLPHACVEWGAKDGTTRQSLFMLDSGAGGASVMLHWREAEFLPDGDVQRTAQQTLHAVGGDGGSKISMQVQPCTLSWLRMGALRLRRVHCLLCEGAGMELSRYSSGIIGGSVLQQRRLVFDVARGRLAVFAPRRGGA